MSETDEARGPSIWAETTVEAWMRKHAVSGLTGSARAALEQLLDAARREGAAQMREAVLQIGPTTDDLVAVGKALMRHTSISHLTSEELGAAAFDASLRLTGAFKKRVRAIEVAPLPGDQT